MIPEVSPSCECHCVSSNSNNERMMLPLVKGQFSKKVKSRHSNKRKMTSSNFSSNEGTSKV